jgi:hypothetical protein
MIPIPVFWTEYTAKAEGRILKLVTCEKCTTEYVYVMQRESVGAGTSFYHLNDGGAANHATSAADETLSDVLKNDFDPIPCPSCGHYQRFMFPKLVGNTGLWVNIALVVVSFASCLAAVSAIHRSVVYVQRSKDDDFGKMIIGWSVFLVLGIAGIGLSVLNKINVRRFDPNVGDPQRRIAIGRSRAVTLSDFETGQQGLCQGEADTGAE